MVESFLSWTILPLAAGTALSFAVERLLRFAPALWVARRKHAPRER